MLAIIYPYHILSVLVPGFKPITAASGEQQIFLSLQMGIRRKEMNQVLRVMDHIPSPYICALSVTFVSLESGYYQKYFVMVGDNRLLGASVFALFLRKIDLSSCF